MHELVKVVTTNAAVVELAPTAMSEAKAAANLMRADSEHDQSPPGDFVAPMEAHLEALDDALRLTSPGCYAAFGPPDYYGGRGSTGRTAT